MSDINNYINIIAIFEEEKKPSQNISIFYFGFWTNGV